VRNSVAFSPDSKLLAVGSRLRAKVDLWDLEKGAAIRSLEYAKADVKDAHAREVLFGGDSALIAVFGATRLEEREIVVFDHKLGTQRATIPLGGGGPRAFAVSPDGSKIAAAPVVKQGRDEVKVWEADTGRLVALLDDPHSCTDIVFSRDGKWLATVRGFSDAKGQVIIWDAKTLEERRSIRAGAGWLNLAVSADGKFIAAGVNRHRNLKLPQSGVRLWEVETGKERGWMPGYEIPGRPQANVYLQFAPDRPVLAATCFNPPEGDSQIKLWDLTSGEQRVVEQGNPLAAGAEFSPDGNLFATPFTAAGPRIKLWSTKYGNLVRTLDMSNKSDANSLLNGGRSHVLRFLFSPDSRWLAAVRDQPSSSVQEVVVWDLADAADQATRSQTE